MLKHFNIYDKFNIRVTYSMNLKQLKYFQILAKNQHYTYTSEYFSISQPSLSHAIAELEKEVGIKLFQKKGRNVELTKEGEQYLIYVNQALQSLNEGEQFVKELTSISHGHIRLAFVYSLSLNYVPKIIQSFTALPQYENISFSFYEDLSRNIVHELKNKHYDIGLCSYVNDDPEIEFTRLAKQEIVFIISNDNPLSKRKKLDLKDIADEPVILYTQRSGMRGYLDNMIAESGVVLNNVVSRVESENAMIGLASINYGIGMMVRVPVPAESNVSLIPMNKNRQKRDIYIATVKNRPLMPVAQKFYRFLTKYCGDGFFNI